MKWKILMIPFILLILTAFSGCGMMGMHGLSGMSHYNMEPRETVIKQVEQDGLVGELTAPHLVAGEPALFHLLIRDENGPVSNALVDFLFLDQNGTAETIQVVGGQQQGMYEVEYTPGYKGPLLIAGEIYGLPQTDGVRVELQKNVMPGQTGIWSGGTKYVVGGLTMGLMMLWMSGTGWH